MKKSARGKNSKFCAILVYAHIHCYVAKQQKFDSYYWNILNAEILARLKSKCDYYYYLATMLSNSFVFNFSFLVSAKGNKRKEIVVDCTGDFSTSPSWIPYTRRGKINLKFFDSLKSIFGKSINWQQNPNALIRLILPCSHVLEIQIYDDFRCCRRCCSLTPIHIFTARMKINYVFV